MFDVISLDEALTVLGQLLWDRRQAFDVVAIGGGGLLLIGLMARPTKDLDLVAMRNGDVLSEIFVLPPELVEAIEDIARMLDLPPDWINNGPASMIKLGLPQGFWAEPTAESMEGSRFRSPVASTRFISSSTPPLTIVPMASITWTSGGSNQQRKSCVLPNPGPALMTPPKASR